MVWSTPRGTCRFWDDDDDDDDDMVQLIMRKREVRVVFPWARKDCLVQDSRTDVLRTQMRIQFE
jgi:hypothetical protein